jgi:hypothetical protein
MRADPIDADEFQLRRFARESIQIVESLSEDQVRALASRLILLVRDFNSGSAELSDEGAQLAGWLWEMTKLVWADVTADQELVAALQGRRSADEQWLHSAILVRLRELVPL